MKKLKFGEQYKEQKQGFLNLEQLEEKKIVADIKKDFEQRREQRKPLELQWRLNMNFYNGNQYAEISPVGDIEQYGKQYFWQEREVYNHIASIVETRLSKLARTNCALSARPMSNQDGDLESAKLSTKIIKAVCEENKLSSMINTATSWSEVTGSCFFKVVWDSEKGRVLGKNKSGQDVKEGDVSISIVPPYEIFPDNLYNSDIDDCRSIIHAKAYNIDDVKDIWGIDVVGEDVDVFGLENAGIGGGLGYQASVQNMPSQRTNDSCVVIEKYTRPTKSFPNGRLEIVAGDKLLHQGELPFINQADGKRGFPFSKIICLDKVGCFFGTSIVERMIPLQRAYNAVKNRKHEFMNRLSMGVLAVEDGSCDLDNLEEEGLSPGKILIYRQGSTPPRILDSGNVPIEFRSEEDRILSEFITISGVSELSKYSQTYSSMSGRAISLLVEQDDTRLSIASTSIRLCNKKICEQIMRLYKQFATGKRLKRFCGDDGVVELTYFKACDLQSEDLVFDNENEMTDTLAGRRNMVLELVKMGLLFDENGKINNRNKSKILELLGFGNWETMRDIDDSHRKKAIKENLDMENGEIVVDELDDHQIHIDEHIRKLLLQSDSKNYEKLKAHINEHKLVINMQSQAMINAEDNKNVE